MLCVCQVFQGNTNPSDVVKSKLPKPTLTRYLRIRPYAWEAGIALRFEVYGCKISGWLRRNRAYFWPVFAGACSNLSHSLFRSKVLIYIRLNAPKGSHVLSTRHSSMSSQLDGLRFAKVFIHAAESLLRVLYAPSSSYVVYKCARQQKDLCFRVTSRLDELHSTWMPGTACATVALPTSLLQPEFCFYPPPLRPNLSTSLAHSQMPTLHMPRSTPTSRTQPQLAPASFAYSSTCFDSAPPHRALIAKAFVLSAPPRWVHFCMCRRRACVCHHALSICLMHIVHRRLIFGVVVHT